MKQIVRFSEERKSMETLELVKPFFLVLMTMSLFTLLIMVPR